MNSKRFLKILLQNNITALAIKRPVYNYRWGVFSWYTYVSGVAVLATPGEHDFGFSYTTRIINNFLPVSFHFRLLSMDNGTFHEKRLSVLPYIPFFCPRDTYTFTESSMAKRNDEKSSSLLHDSKQKTSNNSTNIFPLSLIEQKKKKLQIPAIMVCFFFHLDSSYVLLNIVKLWFSQNPEKCWTCGADLHQ